MRVKTTVKGSLFYVGSRVSVPPPATSLKENEMQAKTSVRRVCGAGLRARALKAQTGVKAGALQPNHSQTLVRARSLKVKTTIKAGSLTANHNETQVRAGGLKVQTSIKAGGVIIHE
jgi:hypothetical protein